MTLPISTAVQALLEEVKQHQRGVRHTPELHQQRTDWIHRYAQAWGGQCLSNAPCVDTNHQKHLLHCQEGHEWQTTYARLRRGGWCKQCFAQHRSTPIELAHAVAHKNGGWCLSHEVRKVTLAKWRCAQGHEWSALYGNIKKGHWCPECARVRNSTPFEDILELIDRYGGVLLSERSHYQNGSSKLLMRCNSGHVFKKTGISLKMGHWCGRCFSMGQRKYSLVDLYEFAAKQGGKCLDQVYNGSNRFYTWECTHGHRWQCKWGNMLKNYDDKDKEWCPECRIVIYAARRKERQRQQNRKHYARLKQARALVKSGDGQSVATQARKI